MTLKKNWQDIISLRAKTETWYFSNMMQGHYPPDKDVWSNNIK
jgi:hypothetical protein